MPDRLRGRLKGIDETILPDHSHAMTASTMDAVTGRIGRALSPTGAAVHRAMAPTDMLAAFAGVLRTNEQAPATCHASTRLPDSRGAGAWPTPSTTLDGRFLARASAARADVIASGGRKLLAVSGDGDVAVATPREFSDRWL